VRSNKANTGGVHIMGNDHKKIIIVMVEQLDESDIRFLVQIYTIIKKYLNRRGRH